MPALPFSQIDAFTDRPFCGNPAAVFLLEDALPDDLMQAIAHEMNLSETAFVLLRAEHQNPLLRWFTTMGEIDLCGHATLASAHACFAGPMKGRDSITFDTVFAGPLTVTRNGRGYEMDFPARAGKPVTYSDIPETVLTALHPVARPEAAFMARDLMLVYHDEATVRAIAPDFNALMDYGPRIIVTAVCDDTGFDFVSRFFCAGDAMPEDPVTGSAHCTLVPYWAERLGKTQMHAFQASKRGGMLGLRLVDQRVFINGEAVTILDGQLYLPGQ